MAAPKGFSWGQIALHWLVAALLVPQYLLHDGIKHAFFRSLRGEAWEATATLQFHIWGGLAIFALVLWRLALRLKRGVPAPLPGGNPLLETVAKLVHLGLYVVLLLMPLAGLLAWFGLSRVGAELHEASKLALLALVALHVAGALYHQFVLRDGLMARMKRPQ